MTILNMANMNTLFRKGYLLAGVIMAANMFVGNKVMALEDFKNNKNKKNNKIDSAEIINLDNAKIINLEKKDEGKKTLALESVLNFALSWENTINLVGGVVFSGANNYLKWWDYNPGSYFKLGCFGWRSGRLIKDIFQFDINFNLGRGILWLILGAYNLRKFIKDVYNNIDYAKSLHVSFLVGGCYGGKRTLIIVFLVQGFISLPLTLHFSNFSISISLDSIIWAGIGKFLDKGEQEEDEEEENADYNEPQLNLNKSNNENN